MIRVLSITIYNAGNSDRLHYESFREKSFINERILKLWTDHLEKEWGVITGFPVKAYPVRRRKPKISVDKYQLLMNTAKVMGVSIDGVLSESRRRVFVDVRKIACMILIDADYSVPDIEKELPFKNRIIYTYREKIEDRLATEPGFEDKYEEIKRKVMLLTNGIKYETDQVKN